MKVLLTTLNSKFIHSCLALRYLKSYSEDILPSIELEEYTINQHNDFIVGEIFKKQPDVVAFSCYIWNMEQILEIAQALKIVKPEIKIVLGGPEVSYDSKELMNRHPYIDFIVYGEGEATFRELVIGFINGENNYSDILGLVYRKEGKIIKNKPRPLIDNLDEIPSPFKGDLSEFKNKIIYYESSRGCPFNCQFCLSSTIKGVRFFSLDRVKQDLEYIIKAGVKQVKFVDRTFNTKKDYALEIMRFIMSKNVRNINFHFEVTAHLLDEDMLKFLKDVPEGLFQFEIGVQSTNPETIKAIDRKTNFEKLAEVTKRIKSYRNIHQHLDLIAGLPYEDYNTFRKSFNDVYNLKPDKLQLGFLKLLKGSGLRQNVEKYGFKFLDKPPYEVLENKYISYNEMLKLKVIEDLVEKYSNEHNFENTLEFIINKFYKTPIEFFEEFSDYWEQRNLHQKSHSKRGLYCILYEFYIDKIKEKEDIFNELLKFDYILNNKGGNIPKNIKKYNNYNMKKKRHDFLKEERNVAKYLSQYKDLPPKKIIKDIHFEEFKFNIIDFIKKGYNEEEIKKNTSIVLFVYDNDKKVFDRCKSYDVTKEIQKLE
ncbi:B12-binding domain-containing radical SAM protein [Caldisalinibacter kiritimatiensis]|uniref:Fe-S oxidoreductase n=1 Tax=Caldisalinibacter kiritimatiensis TaxID=1304284 RepID=R1AQL1_9FIRM|nr:B12-binding domain-containing radical SAM protein [Caldisalinibacter kiritimatiensis]EOC99412.1 Fe-S oxidoreductase [Caldisalinibacter kiritimatiensis]